jgi:hypothetical protein
MIAKAAWAIVLFGAAVPFVTALLAGFALRRFSRLLPHCLGVVAALWASFAVSMRRLPTLPPEEALHWLFYGAVALYGTLLLVAYLCRMGRGGRSAGRGPGVGGLWAVVLLSVPLQLFGGSVLYTQLTLALGSAALAASLFRSRGELNRSFMWMLLLLLNGALLLYAAVLSSLPPLATSLALAAGPAALVAGTYVPPATKAGRTVPLGVALALMAGALATAFDASILEGYGF